MNYKEWKEHIMNEAPTNPDSFKKNEDALKRMRSKYGSYFSLRMLKEEIKRGTSIEEVLTEFRII